MKKGKKKLSKFELENVENNEEEKELNNQLDFYSQD